MPGHFPTTGDLERTRVSLAASLASVCRYHRLAQQRSHPQFCLDAGMSVVHGRQGVQTRRYAGRSDLLVTHRLHMVDCGSDVRSDVAMCDNLWDDVWVDVA